MRRCGRALDTAQKQHAAAQAKCAQLCGKIATLHTQTDAAPAADIAALQAQCDALSARTDALQLQMNALDTRLQQNRTARAKLDTQRQEYDAAHERWQWVHALAATANGAIPGQEKITLEAFLQAAYFDRILGRANTRLLIMSGGQYELRRCERAGDNRSQTGLELEVVDHYNGTARSVKTLSGGETFAASLSLALGLSDEVQSSAGGVQLEAMFVDEGFGSLDSEALQQALTALVGVSGRLPDRGHHLPRRGAQGAHRPADHRHERPQRRQPRAGAGITMQNDAKNVPGSFSCRGRISLSKTS